MLIVSSTVRNQRLDGEGIGSRFAAGVTEEGHRRDGLASGLEGVRDVIHTACGYAVDARGQVGQGREFLC